MALVKSFHVVVVRPDLPQRVLLDGLCVEAIVFQFADDSFPYGRAHQPATARGMSSHNLPSSSLPPAFGVRPPHCLKKNGTLAA